MSLSKRSLRDGCGHVEPLEQRNLLSVNVLDLTTFVAQSSADWVNTGSFFPVTSIPGDFDGSDPTPVELAVLLKNGSTDQYSVRFWRRDTNTTITDRPAGAFTFTAASGEFISTLHAFDANGDGKLDLLAGRFLALNDGSGGFGAPTALAPFEAAGMKVVPVKADADADTDLGVALPNGSVRFYTNNGAGVFTLAASLNRTLSRLSVESAALPASAGRTAEGLITWTNAASEIFLLNGSNITQVASPAAPETVLGYRQPVLVTADLTGDGIVDLAWNVLVSSSPDAGHYVVRVAPGQANGSFAATIDLRQISAIEQAPDLDADNIADFYGLNDARASTSSAPSSNPMIVLGCQGYDSIFTAQSLTSLIPSTPRFSGEPGQAHFADWDGDGDRDLLRPIYLNPGSEGFLKFDWQRNDGGRSTQIVPIDLPSPDLYAFESYASFAPAGMTMYIDANHNGRLDSDEQAATSNEGLINDNTSPGLRSFIFLAPDFSQARSMTFRAWTSLFMPEGYRQLDFVNEYIPMVNPHDVAVDYRVVVHYDSGPLEHQVGSGTMPPRTRGGFTLTERGRYDQSLVRPNVPYAVEVRSTLGIGATFVHYDSFGAPGLGQATGESMTAEFTRFTSFADVSADEADYILFYAKNDAAITLTFLGDDGTTVVHTTNVDAKRRGGALVREVPGIRTGVRYAVSITSTADIIASLTNYGSGRASLTLGGDGSLGSIMPVEVRTGLSTTATFYNPGNTQGEVTLNFENAAGQQQTLVYPVRPRARLDLNLASLIPPGVAAPWRVSCTAPGLYGLNRSTDATRRDELRTTAARAGTYFLFAEGYMRQADNGVNYQDSIAVRNDNPTAANLELVFHLPDGRSAWATLVVPATSARIVKLWELPQLMTLPGLDWYATRLRSDVPITATFTHWDLTQPGGFTIG